jgi:hypothetical protein
MENYEKDCFQHSSVISLLICWWVWTANHVLAWKNREKLEKTLSPKQTMDDLKEKALLILPQIVNPNKDSDQGLIDISLMREKLRIPHNKAYRMRKLLLRELHEDNDKLLRELRQGKVGSEA